MLSRKEKAGVGAVVTVWVLIALTNIGIWGVIVWAIIKLVNANS